MESPTQLPQAPRISGDTMLEIFVHRSLRYPGAPLSAQTAYGDADRLASVGNKMLEVLGRHGWRKSQAPMSQATNASAKVCDEVAA